jgi:RNA recognition motif-containing protein
MGKCVISRFMGLAPWLLVDQHFPMTIYIGNLSYRATEDDLKEVFADYGTVTRVALPTDRETGRMRGFAFVELEEDAQEDAAIAELDGAEWMGRQLKVNKAKPKEDSRSVVKRVSA